MTRSYDVVVVGSRVAGAPTAMLLARRGLDVLLLDRARFPSDTLSSHQIQVPGAATLNRWGLLDQVLDDGDPGVTEIRLDVDQVVMEGRLPSIDGISRLVSPRRTRLDDLLVRAASDAGATVEHALTAEEVLVEGGRAVGLGARSRSGARITVRAGLVIGADGKHSFVAKAVGSRTTRGRPNATVAMYSYWSGVPTGRAELYHRHGAAVAVFPTDGGLTVVFLAVPLTAFAEARRDPEAAVLRRLDGCGEIGDRVRAGRREERIRLTPDVPHLMRVPAGPGWALVGDAGLVMDPVSAQGITVAFRSADLLDQTVGAALGAGRPPGPGLEEYARRRDLAFTGMFDLTSSLADLDPRGGTRTLMRRVARRQMEVDRLLSVFSGVEPPDHFFSAPHMARLLGWRAAAVVLERARQAGRRSGAVLRRPPVDSGHPGESVLSLDTGGDRLDAWTTN